MTDVLLLAGVVLVTFAATLTLAVRWSRRWDAIYLTTMFGGIALVGVAVIAKVIG